MSFIPSFEELQHALCSFQYLGDLGKSVSDATPADPVKINTKPFAPFNLDTHTLENIGNYLAKVTFQKRTFIHKKESQLPFSLAYNAIDRKVFLKTKGLPPIAFGTCCNLVAGLDLQDHLEVVYRSMPSSFVTQAERDINIELSARPDLFVATKEIYDYKGSFNLKEDGDNTAPLRKSKIPKTCFILERLDIDLLDLSNEEKLSFRKKFDIVCDVAKALDVLHNEYKIVHRDIKLENIFISKCSGARKYCAKIGDFGQSQYFDKTPFLGGGTTLYVPPEWVLFAFENIKNKTPDNYPTADFTSDMWSFGVALLVLFGSQSTFECWENISEKNRFLHDDFPSLKEKVIAMIEDDRDKRMDLIIELIRGCLEVNPEKRLTIRKTLEKLGIS